MSRRHYGEPETLAEMRAWEWEREVLDGRSPADSPRRRYHVEIVECRTDGRRWSTNVLARSRHEAERVAIRRIWGRDASLWPDSGIPGGEIGQIVTPCDTGGSTCETGRVRVDVSTGWDS